MKTAVTVKPTVVLVHHNLRLLPPQPVPMAIGNNDFVGVRAANQTRCYLDGVLVQRMPTVQRSMTVYLMQIVIQIFLPILTCKLPVLCPAHP